MAYAGIAWSFIVAASLTLSFYGVNALVWHNKVASSFWLIMFLVVLVAGLLEEVWLMNRGANIK